MNARNPFADLATLAALVAPAPILAQEWQGAWNTTYGQIRLVEDGDYVYGDYGNIGTIEGVLVNGKQVLRAVFTRRDTKQTGYVEWVQSGDDGNRITGRWNWTSAPVPDWQEEASGGLWRGDRTDDGIPPIIQFGPRRSRGQFLASAGSAYRNWIRPAPNTSRAGAIAAPPAKSGDSPTVAPSTPSLIGRFPVLANYPANFAPRYFDVRLTRMLVGEEVFTELYGLVGIYAYCETPTESYPLKPFGGLPNRVFDVARENASRVVIYDFQPAQATRRFALDERCLAGPDNRIAIQVQSNMKEKDNIPRFDEKWGYRSIKFYLGDLPTSENLTVGTGGADSLKFRFSVDESVPLFFVAHELPNSARTTNKLRIDGLVRFVP